MEVTQNQQEPENESIKIQEIIYWCLKKWYWFVISLAVTISFAVFYLLKTPPVYTRSAELLMKDDSKGDKFYTSMEQSFSEMGLMKVNNNVKNEILVIKSLNAMTEVVNRLNLNINYTTEGTFHDEVLYGTTLPCKVHFLDFPENGAGGFTMTRDDKGRMVMTNWLVPVEEGEEPVVDKVVTAALNDTVATPMGRLVVQPTAYYDKKKPFLVKVSYAPVYGTAQGYAGSLQANLTEKEATVVRLSLNDVCPQRAEDVLNMVIAVYSEDWLKDKNEIAIGTSMFINERLAVIEQELGNVDENISAFKSKNLLPDVKAASNLYMTLHTQTNTQIMDLNTQLYMTRYIRKYITDNKQKFQLLPVNSGIENMNIESQINQYNSQVLERNKLVANSGEHNPLVVDLDFSLRSMREAIIISIDNQLETLNAQIQSLLASEDKTTSKIAANPSQAKYLLTVERQQKVKETLYLFLLQKREENELLQAFTAYNTRVITKPNGSSAPSSPNRKMVLLVAVVLGIMFPALIIFLREFLNAKIRGRIDVESLSIPFIGEIPLFDDGRKHWPRKKERGKNFIVVKEGERNIINEAFRILRTNLEFITETKEKSNVMLLTSYNQGSGKSFLTMNIALSLAIKAKKVLVIDGDMRYAASSTYVGSPKVGLSSYLNGLVDKWQDIIVPDEKYPNMEVLPVGILPPNPTELLYGNRLADLISEARNAYDYVLIDCPPIEVVADVQLIGKYVDRTIFIIRAGLLKRTVLPELQRLYDENKYKNMVLVLNGTESPSSAYDYRYSYRYGYHYGHYVHYMHDMAKGNRYRGKHKWIIK